MSSFGIRSLHVEANNAVEPVIPFCRKQFGSSAIWLPEPDESDGVVRLAKRFVIFGGVGKNYVTNPKRKKNNYLNDLWSLQITTTGFVWTELDNGTGFAPDPRWKCSLDSYKESKALLLFGGDNSGSSNNIENDIWSYAPTISEETSWTKLRETVFSQTDPGSRRSAGTAVTASNMLVITNGKIPDDYSTCDSRTFSLDLNDPSQNSWSEIASLPALCRWGHTFTHVVTYPSTTTLSDSASTSYNGFTDIIIDTESNNTDITGNATESIVMFGGRRKESTGIYTYFNELWSFDPVYNNWTFIEPIVADDTNNAAKNVKVIPMPRDHHGAVYVEEMNSLYIYGGRWTNEMVPALDDLWSFNFNTKQWKLHNQPSKTKPSPRFGHGFSVWRGSADDELPSLIVFGGETVYTSGHHDLLNDIWLYSIRDETWRNVGYSDCNPGATGVIMHPIIPVNVLFSIAGLVIVLGVCISGYLLIKRCRKRHYIPIMPIETQQFYRP